MRPEPVRPAGTAKTFPEGENLEEVLKFKINLIDLGIVLWFSCLFVCVHTLFTFYLNTIRLGPDELRLK